MVESSNGNVQDMVYEAPDGGARVDYIFDFDKQYPGRWAVSLNSSDNLNFQTEDSVELRPLKSKCKSAICDKLRLFVLKYERYYQFMLCLPM